MADDFGNRAFWALQREEQRLRRTLPQRELGQRVSDRLGKKEPMHQSTVSKWLKPASEGGAIPDVPTVGALAAELHVDPGWLAFGGASQAPAPVGYEAPAPEAPSRQPPVYHGKPVDKSAGGKRRRSS